ncbi:hypothetical protein EV424DRAFT_660262 [Suillus variegatus]|nr:hypothetical protein EV424DRAFT_660262 [Suillus variegatus]
MFFTTPVSTSPYPLDYYLRYRPTVPFAVSTRAAQYLGEQRERAWALRYQQEPVNQPTLIALLAQEYDEFPDRQRMMDVLCACTPQDEEKIGGTMARNHAEMRRMRELQHFVALQAHIEEEQGFARHRANAEKFLAEAEASLSDFLPPDREPYLNTFQPFDLPDTSVRTSTSKVIVEDEPLPKDVIEGCAMTENCVVAEYRFEERDTLQSIFDRLSAGTSTEVPIERVPVPSTAAETSSSMQVNFNEEG